MDNDPARSVAGDTAPSRRSLVLELTIPHVDRQSRNSLVPPTSGRLARLVRKARASQPVSVAAHVKPAPTRSLRRKFPPEVIREIVQRYKSGEYTTDLSSEYGISKSGLLKLLRAEGVSMRKQSITSEDTNRAVMHYESGMTITQEVDQVGYSFGTIRRALHERDVAVRPSAIRRKRESGTG